LWKYISDGAFREQLPGLRNGLRRNAMSFLRSGKHYGGWGWLLISFVGAKFSGNEKVEMDTPLVFGGVWFGAIDVGCIGYRSQPPKYC
jgi:hypothetical protein